MVVATSTISSKVYLPVKYNLGVFSSFEGRNQDGLSATFPATA
jgi:hypothetical protein